MSSAAKTLDLLSHFSTLRPEIGLSQMCRIAGRDKATTYRHLQALEAAGFVEQNPLTKLYRLGPALLQLAQIREATVPRKDSAQVVLQRLAVATGETAHVSVLSGKVLYSLASCESPRHSTRAIIDINSFPLHATASGLCTLAFGPEALFDLAAKGLERFTQTTPTSRATLADLVTQARQSGFGLGAQSYEAEIHGVATPLFDQTGGFAGAVAVACVASRFGPDLHRTITSELARASRDITQAWGGRVPSHIETAWARTLARPTALEPAL